MSRVLFVCAVLLVYVSAEALEKYTDEFDSFDVDEVLNNKRLFNYYLACARTGKNCPPQIEKLKALIPDALSNGCARCTDEQLRKGRIVADFILKNHPDIFLEFENIYDPNRTYRKMYAQRLKDEGIVLPD